MVSIDQEIEVQILHIDHEKEKIALGLKQRTPSPWETVEQKYPVGSRIKGTRGQRDELRGVRQARRGHRGPGPHQRNVVDPADQPSQRIGPTSTTKSKSSCWASTRRSRKSRWASSRPRKTPGTASADRYPLGSIVKGTVRNLTNYGAFIEIEEGIDGLLHVSDMSWTRKISHPNEMVEKGQEIECRVLSVDQDRRRIALGLKQMADDPWATDIPGKYQPGQIVKGPVTKITNFGVFVGLENGLEGLLHISELADHKVENPEDVVKVGEVIEVKVLRVDADERKIGLSRKRVEWAEEAEAEGGQAARAAASIDTAELKGGVGDSSGPLFKHPERPAAGRRQTGRTGNSGLAGIFGSNRDSPYFRGHVASDGRRKWTVPRRRPRMSPLSD